MLDHDLWVDSARAITTFEAAELLGFTPQKNTNLKERVGGCPACGGNDRFSIVVSGSKTGVFNCRKCSIKGGDGLALVMAVQNVDFLKACEFLVGESPKGTQWTEAEKTEYRVQQDVMRQKRLKKQSKLEAKQEQELAERQAKAADLWANSVDWQGSDVEHYLRFRRIIPVDFNDGAIAQLKIENLRLKPMLDYYHQGQFYGSARAMIGHIQDAAGHLIGVHRTWINGKNDDSFNGRPLWFDVETGHKLDTKKVLGAQKGGVIRLVRGTSYDEHGTLLPPLKLYIGEGIETVLSVYTALFYHEEFNLDRWAFWCGLNLGNLANITAPTCIKEVVLLGDGDSDHDATRRAMQKTAHSFFAQGKAVSLAFAPKGFDFNDILCGKMKKQEEIVA